jgi:aldehyde dehydrogenase (NAD+)
MDIKQLVDIQREFFYSGYTKDVHHRLTVLHCIKDWIIKNDSLIIEALKQDLNKHSTESYMCEIGLVLSELNYQIKHIKKWSKKKRVRTPLAQFYATSYKTYEPYGVTLVMSPWNYPFMLAIEPAIGAISAGNTVIIKPSAYASHVSHVIKQMIQETCLEQYVAVVEGGRKENTELLEQRFDYIFFTGSVHVGKLVMEKASRHLTPVTLELGGKSPCIVDDEKSLRLAVKRIAFGKFLNAGQTCVAPDYLLIKEDLKDSFIVYMKEIIIDMFGSHPLQNDQFVKIINQKHFERLIDLLKNQNIIIGGEYDSKTLKISPTIIECPSNDNPLMQEEIFGPILPVITYHHIQEAIDYINQHEKPLALYLFSHHKDIQDLILKSCSFGGGCINDTIIHLASTQLGFGGVGYSGMGAYHGYKSFETFSHERSLVKKGTWIDMPLRYYPYTSFKEKLIRLFVK